MQGDRHFPNPPRWFWAIGAVDLAVLLFVPPVIGLPVVTAGSALIWWKWKEARDLMTRQPTFRRKPQDPPQARPKV
jgi:hypothetical protein